MELNTKIISFISGLNWGNALTNLPVQVIEFYGTKTRTNTEDEAIISTLEVALCVGAAFGTILTPIYVQKLGFTNSLIILFGLQMLFSGLTMVPVHWIYLTVIRTITGLVTSSISSLTPLLVAEVLSPKERGHTMMNFAIALNLGIVLAYVIHLLTSFNYEFWMLNFAFPVVCGFVALFCLRKIYVKQKEMRKISLKEQRNDLMEQENQMDAIQHSDEMISATFIKSSAEETSNTFARRVQTSSPDQFNKKLTKTQFKRVVYITVALGMMQMFTGADAIIIYASDIFESLFKSEKSGIYASLIIGVVNLVYTLIAVPIAEKQKRRNILMTGVIGVSLCHVIIAALYFFHCNKLYVLAALLLLFFFYNIGPEPIVFMLFSEMFPQKYKVKLNGLGYTVNWISNIISVFIFQFFQNGKEHFVYLLFGLLTITLGVSGTILAPETFEKTLMDIEIQIRAWTKKSERKVRREGLEMKAVVMNLQNQQIQVKE
ncbi:Hexose_transporter [Hexamita inflata]|uniref:Hexose transporter n=1 Tax=Hexamita inflata TaxID=28002 RepID=A0AA86Q6W6_9EUKA|nr:Hexose transporter [Hexamita inflata]